MSVPTEKQGETVKILIQDAGTRDLRSSACQESWMATSLIERLWLEESPMACKLHHMGPVLPPEGGIPILIIDTNIRLYLLQDLQHANPSMRIRNSNRERTTNNKNMVTVFGSHDIGPNKF